MTENDSVYVTKELLLKGMNHIEDVPTEIGVFRIRPLTAGEKAKIESLAVRGIKAHGRREDIQNLNVDMELEQIITNNWDIQFIILSCGLSVDKNNPITVNDIKNACLPDGIIQKLAMEIRRVSGMLEDTSPALRQFRSESGRTATNNSDTIRSD